MKRPKVLRRPCPGCGNTNKNSHKVLYYTPPLTILQCLECGLVFVNQQLSTQEVGKLSINGFLETEKMRFAKAKADYKELIRLVEKSGKILDVGFGLGHFLKEAKLKGWNAKGLEINKTAIDKLANEGLNVKAGSIEGRTDFPDNHFDVITMFGVIEHLVRPSKAMEECNRLLRPGGILCLQTPTEDGLFRKVGRLLYKISFGKIDFHVNQLYSVNGGHNLCFSRRSIKSLLDKHGFEILKIDGSTYGLHILLRRFNKTPVGILKILGTSTLYAFAKLLQMPNHMKVYAQKKS